MYAMTRSEMCIHACTATVCDPVWKSMGVQTIHIDPGSVRYKYNVHNFVMS